MSRNFFVSISMLAALCFSLSACKEEEKKKEWLPSGLQTLLLNRGYDSSRKVEIFWMEPGTAKPWPAVIYLHGHQEGELQGGRAFYDWGVLKHASGRGFLAVGVSLPGYGKSTGPRDFAGPDSQEAVADVIRQVRRRSEVRGDRIAIVGTSRGATVAARVGEMVAGLAGLVLISGIYEAGESYRRWKLEKGPEMKDLTASFEFETGMSDAGLTEITVRERSVLPDPQIRAPTLIIHGGKDLVTSQTQAELLADKLKRKEVDAKVVVYQESGHHIPVIVREQEIDPFLSKVLFKDSAAK